MFLVHTTPEEFKNGGFTTKTHQMFSIHTTSEEFENRVFTLKTHQIFCVHITSEEFKNTAINGHFGDYRNAIVFKTFSVHNKMETRRFKFLLFQKVRFLDGLVWTVGLTGVEIKLPLHDRYV